MKRLVLLVFIFLQGIFVFSQLPAEDSFNCFTIIAGKDATAKGVVTLAHNEDDHGKNIINLLKVKTPDTQKYHTKQGEEIQRAGKNKHGFLWIEMPGQDFAGSYVNDNGVVVVSNACPSKEDKPELTGGGISFMFRRMLAEYAGSAKEAVEIGGKLIEKYGYDSSGRTYCIADKDEAWVLAVVNGKHWVAQRVPDEEVVVVPNYYTITDIRLEDKENFMGSDDIVDYAIKKGWYKPDKDETFNFRKAYGKPESLAHPGNITRKWQGLNMITGKNYPLDKPFPFSVKPNEKLTVKGLMNIMANHYEGTEFDASNNYRNRHPHKNTIHTICASHNQYSMVVDFKEDVSEAMGTLVWIAFRRPCTQAFIPLFTGLERFPSSTRLHDADKALKNHLSSGKTIQLNGNHFFTDYIKYSGFTDKHYAEVIDDISEYKHKQQKLLFERVDDIETNFHNMHKQSPEKANAMLLDFTGELLKNNSMFMKKLMEKSREAVDKD
ncbi:MAG: C69 family dipeptidase [Bacteroidales bacterium]